MMQALKKLKAYDVLFIAICAVTTLLAMIVRLRYLNMPFERDEGEYAYAGQLILKGIAPYKEAYNMKFPGTYLMYALFTFVFGQSIIAIRVGVILLQVLQYIFLYKTAKQLFSWRAGWLTVAVMALLNISLNAIAINTNAEHFVITFTIIGFYFAVKTDGRPSFINYFAMGFSFALAVLMKQHAIYFIPAMMAVCFYRTVFNKHYNSLPAFILGGALPTLLVGVWLYATGAFPAFKFWCFDYAGAYVAIVGTKLACLNLYHNGLPIIKEYWLIALAAIVGLGALMFSRKISMTNKILLLLLVIASALATTPGYYFRPHYFIVLFPAIALLAAYMVDKVLSYFEPKSPQFMIAGLVAFCSLYFLQNFTYCFRWTDDNALDYMYPGIEPFAASVKMADYIQSISTDTDRLYCVVPEPQIYFYANRQSATPYIYIYPLLEHQKYADTMTTDFFNKVNAAQAKILVVKDHGWLPGNHQDTVLYNFFKAYQQQYDLKAVMYSTRTEDGARKDIFLKEGELKDSSSMPWAVQIKILKRKEGK